jgi:hypothetical protein
MSNTLTINDYSGFVNGFLNSISKVSEDCIINVDSDKISCLTSTSDGTLVQYVELKNDSTFEQTLNVPDVKRLHKIVGCLPVGDIALGIDTNSISYKSSETRFKFYLLDDGILASPAISLDKIKQLQYDVNFRIDHVKLTELIKGSTFANETEKLYLYTDENNSLYGELTDKEKPNMDSFCIKLADNLEKPISPIAFNFESFRIISTTRTNQIDFNINTELSVARVNLQHDQCNISYIASALLK